MVQWEAHNYDIVFPKKSSMKLFKPLDIATIYRQYRVTKIYVSDIVVGRIMVPKGVHCPVMSPEAFMVKQDLKM